MKWKYCEDCYINGHCENQDRGHECNIYAKRITDKCERLQKQLDIAVKALTTYSQSNSTIVVFRDIDGWNVQTEIYDKCSEIAEKALKEIEELNK